MASVICIEIRYAPGGDENKIAEDNEESLFKLRLDMPREGTKTKTSYLLVSSLYVLRLDMPREGTKTYRYST